MKLSVSSEVLYGYASVGEKGSASKAKGNFIVVIFVVIRHVLICTNDDIPRSQKRASTTSTFVTLKVYHGVFHELSTADSFMTG